MRYLELGLKVLAGIVVLAFLMYTGILVSILASIPIWAYVLSAVMLLGLLWFVRWAWSQNEVN